MASALRLLPLYIAIPWAGPALSQPIPLDYSERQVNTYTPCDQWRPAVASDPDGSFVVAWTSCGSLGNDDSFSSVQVRRFGADGNPLDAADFQVNMYTAYDQRYPSVASDAEGNFVVVWESYGSAGGDDDGYSIQARRFAADGTPLDAAEFQVNAYTTNLQQRPKVAMDPEGNFVVVWDSWGSPTDSSAYSVQARRFGADGAPLEPTEFQVNTFTSNTQFTPSVGADFDGGFVVGWFSHHLCGGVECTSIEARRYRRDGTPADPAEFRVDTPAGNGVGSPTVGADPAGEFVLAWEITQPITFRESIGARRYRTDGTPVDLFDFEVSSYTTWAQDRPSVSAAANGDFVVAWSSYGSSGDDPGFSVQGRRYRPDGPSVDPGEFQLNAYTTGNQVRPSVSRRLNGDFVVAWQSYGSFGDDSSYWSIQERRFGRPTIEVTSSSGATGGPDCKLRDAIAAANAGQPVGGCPGGNEGAEIELPPGATIVLTVADNGSNGLPLIARPITVRGRGATITRDPGVACPVEPEFRIFEVVAGGILELQDVTVARGCISSGSGGAVLASGGTVLLTRASIVGSEAGSDGGGVAVVDGSLFAAGATVRGNLAAGSGGGISVSGLEGRLLLRRSTLSGNAATFGGGLSHAAGTRALIRTSTLSGNAALGSGGGIEAAGSGAGSRVVLDFSTVTGNFASVGGGLDLGSGTFDLHGSLVGESASGGDCAAGTGVLVATGANLDTDGTCTALAGGHVSTVVSLDLGPLRDNGGFVSTRAPLGGSPSLDAAPDCANRSGAAALTDERGYPRPTDDDGDGAPACDLGAVERGPVFLDGFESGDLSAWSGAGP